MNKGKQLYECDDCHARQFIHPRLFYLASRPKCKGCGCTRLMPVSDDSDNSVCNLRDKAAACSATGHYAHEHGRHRRGA